MSDFRIDKITNRVGDAGTQICGVTTFTGTSGMIIPGGSTEYRGGRGRGVFCGGESPTKINTLDYITIATTGNAADFGDLTEVKSNNSSTGSSTRGVVFGGENPSASKKIDYFTFSSKGGASDFGDLLAVRRGASSNASGNEIRGITGGGNPGSANDNYETNYIEYVTISTTGNSSEFGDLIKDETYMAAFASPTRIVWGGGVDGPPATFSQIIQYKEIASTGDTVDFGQLSAPRGSFGGAASPTRGLYLGGKDPGSTDIIEYITIASLGNATDFGNLTASMSNITACSNSIRAVAGGSNNVLNYVTIATTGNAADYGDLSVGRGYLSACSDSHGGLG